jgi:hypothetical protein
MVGMKNMEGVEKFNTHRQICLVRIGVNKSSKERRER